MFKHKKLKDDINCSTAYFKGLFRYQKHNLFQVNSDIIPFHIYPQINFNFELELLI